MAEELTFISGSKEEQYLSLLPQVRSLIEGEVDLVANLANVAAALKEKSSNLFLVSINAKLFIKERTRKTFENISLLSKN